MQPEGRPQEIPTFASPEEELKYLRERVAQMGGQLVVNSSQHEGTEIIVEVPLQGT